MITSRTVCIVCCPIGIYFTFFCFLFGSFDPSAIRGDRPVRDGPVAASPALPGARAVEPIWRSAGGRNSTLIANQKPVSSAHRNPDNPTSKLLFIVSNIKKGRKDLRDDWACVWAAFSCDWPAPFWTRSWSK